MILLDSGFSGYLLSVNLYLRAGLSTRIKAENGRVKKRVGLERVFSPFLRKACFSNLAWQRMLYLK